MDFRSDNTHGAHPDIVAALADASRGTVSSYGADALTERLRTRLCDLFETDVTVFPVMTGTAGNSLSIAAMTPPWGGVFCHDEAHIHRDEMGAPEFFSNGAKVFPLLSADAKLQAAELDAAIHTIGAEGRTAIPACISVTQATEAGTVYSVDELRAIGEVARKRAVGIHMDGARFANAVASLGCSPADITWRAGVDLLVLGATKNGAFAAEAIVVFRKELAKELTLRIHRAGHRLSKMRYLSAQLDAYLANDLWLRLARHSNAMARRLAAGLPEVLRPVDANVVFARFPAELDARLRAAGFLYYPWILFGPGAVRLVTGWSTTEEEVDRFVAAVKG